MVGSSPLLFNQLTREDDVDATRWLARQIAEWAAQAIVAVLYKITIDNVHELTEEQEQLLQEETEAHTEIMFPVLIAEVGKWLRSMHLLFFKNQNKSN